MGGWEGAKCFFSKKNLKNNILQLKKKTRNNLRNSRLTVYVALYYIPSHINFGFILSMLIFLFVFLYTKELKYM